MSALDRVWPSLGGWRRGAAAGLVVYSLIFALASALCLAEYAGMSSEGYIGAGWMLIILGLPLTAVEALLETLELSLAQQLLNLYVLAFLNWLVIGSVAGHLLEGSGPEET